MFLNKIINEVIKGYEDCNDVQITQEIFDEVNNFNSDEELLRSGGISIDALDRAAFGFSSEDIKSLMPNKLNIKWRDDLDNVKWEIKKSGLSPKKWALSVDLSEPIDVSYWKDENHKEGFYIEDGHHRYAAAKILNKTLNVNLEIKVNPIIKLAPNLSYDDFHRCVFFKVKSYAKTK